MEKTVRSYFSIFKFSICAAIFFFPTLCHCQHTNHEIGFSFAFAGQSPFITSNDDAGFFRKPLMWNLRYQVATNYLQSIAIVLEHVGEERSRIGLWNDIPNSSPVYNAEISEQLSMTTLGLEGIRTFIRTDEFRLGIGIGLAYGFGGATATVKKITDGTSSTFESCDTWNGFLVSAFLRGRYSFYISDKLDLGVTGSLRAWGFPTIGPLTNCSDEYNGPAVRSLFEVGYLAGISVGLK